MRYKACNHDHDLCGWEHPGSYIKGRIDGLRRAADVAQRIRGSIPLVIGAHVFWESCAGMIYTKITELINFEGSTIKKEDHGE